MKSYPPINPHFPHFLHGGDYNPDQWIRTPEIWDEDFRLMKLSGCNTMTLGVFSWATLEPSEGNYDFRFLDAIMDRLAENKMYAVLATPSGARPAWLAEAYPEVLRVDADGIRNRFGFRHNHCFTSPIYREKTQAMSRKLAERYKDHPALLVWHISNEYGGECQCELCCAAFREWLRKKYDNDLNKLNEQWWTSFWSHTYTSWEQILPPSKRTDTGLHGLTLDWRRFVTSQTVDFMRNESAPMRELTPNVPVTVNMMHFFPDLDYHRFRDFVDVISWDSYPAWHDPAAPYLPVEVAFSHNVFRGIKNGMPFMLMESTPSSQNWQPVNKLKRPGMHELASLQAVAHGSDTVQYFQWRKSRGSFEKFHGAVVDHCGHENTRVFREVSKVGEDLSKLDGLIGAGTPAEVAILYDWENRWAVDEISGLKLSRKSYTETCIRHYFPFWKEGINVDVLEMTQDFSGYKLVIAPMLYLLKPGVAEKIRDYVANGGTFVATYITGEVNENDLCYLGGFPAGDLKEVFGLWAEEIDSLYDSERRHVEVTLKGCSASYEAVDYCEIIHETTASVLGRYSDDFYAGTPAVTCNSYGEGKAYYIAFRDTGSFLKEFYAKLQKQLGIRKNLEAELPESVTVTSRESASKQYLFVQNFGEKEAEILLPTGQYEDILEGKTVEGKLALAPFGIHILSLPLEGK